MRENTCASCCGCAVRSKHIWFEKHNVRACVLHACCCACVPWWQQIFLGNSKFDQQDACLGIPKFGPPRRRYCAVFGGVAAKAAEMLTLACAATSLACAMLMVAPTHSIHLHRSTTCMMAADSRILVVGSINIDLYRRLDADSAATFGGFEVPVPLKSVKGMTLPAASFVQKVPGLEGEADDGDEEALVLAMDGPFEQKTGGKGANTAAAVGQTTACEFIGNLGGASKAANAALLADLAKYGAVDVSRCAILPGVPTGTAYILRYPDNDNGIVLIGGANQRWPEAVALREGEQGARLRAAIDGCAAVMLQREVPAHVNVVTAALACARGVPVFMDVGGTDAPIDTALMSHLSVICPNESELTFISGIETRDETGAVLGKRVREAVAALKAQFGAAGNPSIEVLVTLGSGGSVYFGTDWTLDAVDETREICMGCYRLATPDGRPVDTTGAGDCFRGSYVAARYGEGKEVLEAMRWAAAAASLACEVNGAMPSMPSRDQILARVQEPLAFPGGLV